MNLFRVDLQWDNISIMQQTMKILIKNGFTNWDNSELLPNLGFNDSGHDAFIIQAYKNKKAIRIILQNQEQKIIISVGIRTKKEVTNIKTKYFDISEIFKAGKYFESVLN